MTQNTREILPNKLYSPEEAAEVLGLENARSVYSIGQEDLPRTRIGPKRGKAMFLGRDILAYVEAGRDGTGDDT